ncbi:MAG: MOSC domain-containing protein [Xanthobacteraceae bacterium]|nr:MOSC domain-containing protein [Xanthobacteraceae bacterium]
MTTNIGKVGAIMRFPIKSLLGEALDECAISTSGLRGDRALALLDTATGKIASAKQPNLWRDMLAFAAKTDPSTAQPRIVVSHAAGGQRDHLDADFGAWLSRLLGRSVKLIETRPAGVELNRARPDEVLEQGMDEAVTQDVLAIGAAAPDGGFFDFAPIHLVTAASLDAISGFAPEASIAAERYRPNLVIETTSATAFAENQWVGRRIRIGRSVELEIIAPTPRCAVPLLAHGDLPASPAAVSAVTRLNKVEFPLLGPGKFPCLGAYATVLSAGLIQRGDAVSLA